MKQVKIDTGYMVNLIDVGDDDPTPSPITLKIELIDLETCRILSRGIRIIEIHGNHLVII